MTVTPLTNSYLSNFLSFLVIFHKKLVIFSFGNNLSCQNTWALHQFLQTHLKILWVDFL